MKKLNSSNSSCRWVSGCGSRSFISSSLKKPVDRAFGRPQGRNSKHRVSTDMIRSIRYSTSAWSIHHHHPRMHDLCLSVLNRWSIVLYGWAVVDLFIHYYPVQIPWFYRCSNEKYQNVAWKCLIAACQLAWTHNEIQWSCWGCFKSSHKAEASAISRLAQTSEVWEIDSTCTTRSRCIGFPTQRRRRRRLPSSKSLGLGTSMIKSCFTSISLSFSGHL